MKLLIYIEQSEILEKMVSHSQVNPGIGGTTYTALRLAFELNNAYKFAKSNIKVSLLTKNYKEEYYQGMEVININKLEKYFTDIFLITGDLIDILIEEKIKINTKRVLTWIRHPFDYDKIKKAKRLNSEIVSVGKAQYISNYLIAGKHHHIDNLFCAERIRKSAKLTYFLNNAIIKENKNNKTFVIGYMGALVPSKGFDQLAKQWLEIVKFCLHKNLNPRLEVIGGSTLYGFEENHPRLPTGYKYGNKLESFLQKEINKTVFFHGTLNEERYELMKKCDIAIVNPEGRGEAFPASILEWMCLAIPVISSAKYGCYDAMRFNNSLIIKKPEEIKEKIKFYINLKDDQRNYLKDISYTIANYYSSKQNFIISQWILLLKQKNKYINEYPSLYILYKFFVEWLLEKPKIFLKEIITKIQ